MKLPNSLIFRGVAAGVLGATALAFWFLVIDASLGTPFRTPAFIANSLVGVEGVQGSPGLIIMYTALHYGAFMVVGVAVTWIASKIDTAPSILLGLVLGFLLFDLVFYGSVAVTGVNVVRELGWPEVLAGNLIAGVTVMGFLHVTGPTAPITWWEVLAEHRIVREGIVSGFIGGGAVALWFLVFDLIRGRPFFTPGALGSSLFLGASDLSAIQVDFWTVSGYTVLHMAAFVFTGIVAAAIVCQAEETPPLILAAVLLFVSFEAFFLGLLALVAEFLLGPLAWWTIAVGNILATLSMGYFLWMKHPRLRAALAEDPFDRTD